MNQNELLSDQIVFKPCETSIKSTGKKNFRSSLSQVTAILIQAWLLLDLGMQGSITTIILAALHNRPTEELCLDDEQASWVGSILFFSHPFGSLVSGFLQEKFGRKGSMILVNIPIFVCWITLYKASSIIHLYLVSLTMGLCGGFSEAPLHSYIGEIAEPHLRGTLSTVSSAAGSLGMFLEYIFGFYFTWRVSALISSCIPVITFICMTQIPESPTWFIMKGRMEKAQKSLGWLRGWVSPAQVQTEFDELINFMEEKNNLKDIEKEIELKKGIGKHGTESKGYFKTKYEELTDKKVMRPLRLAFLIFIFSETTSLVALRPYMINIIDEFGFSLDSKFIMVLSGLCIFVGTLLNIIFIRRFGKRRLTLLGQFSCTVIILLLGVYCSFFDRSNSSDRVTWIPIVLIFLSHFCSASSVSLLPWQLICEIFPLKGRGAAGGISVAWAYYVYFALTKTYLYLERWLELRGVFYFYGVFSACGLVYYYYYLPETDGKSLEKIQTYFTENYDHDEKFSLPKTKK